MKPSLLIAAVMACTVTGGGTLHADSFELVGTLRDFSDAHPDFEDTYNAQYPLILNMVKRDLGSDDKPVLNAVPGGITSISVSSSKFDLSNVVLKLTDGTEYKYDGLHQGHTGTFAVPSQHQGKFIVGCWVKAGTNGSGDGPGYGQWVPDDADHVNKDGGGRITVTFTPTSGIPRQWRIESEGSFKQWFRSIAGVNHSVPHVIKLDNGQNRPGGIYRYEASKHNGRSFFPGDDRFMGNQGRSHNYHFTYEIKTTFNYTPRSERDSDLVLNFSGDDDVWVFINRKLVMDLGGVHGEKYGAVNIDSLAGVLGLQPGKTYDFHFFFAERHTTESNFTLETNLPLAPALYD